MKRDLNSVDRDLQQRLRLRQLRVGWLGLFIYLSLGIVLEVMHGLKVDFYLGLHNEPRRMLWTLAHSHGTLFSLVNLAFAGTITQAIVLRGWNIASWCLLGGLLLLPAGFFGGGIWLHGGDPNLMILLVPAGAFLVLSGVGIVLWSLLTQPATNNPNHQ